MNLSHIYCFNPLCGKQYNSSKSNQLKCEGCGHNSLKIGDFYATEIFNNNNNNKIVYFKAHKEGQVNPVYFVKLIYDYDFKIDPHSNAAAYEKLKTENFVEIKKDVELNKKLQRIKEEHPENIPEIERVYHNYFCIYVISKFITGSNLYQKIENGDFSSKDQILKMFKDIALSLNKIHHKRVIHGDIKPKNIKFDGEKYFLVDPIAAKDFNGLKKYTPKKITAYTPPEMWDMTKDLVDKKNNHDYLESYTQTHDLYALSALFIKILSKNHHNDDNVRNADKKWNWNIELDELKDAKKLQDLLGNLVDQKAEFRNNKNIDVIISCIDELSQEKGGMKTLPPEATEGVIITFLRAIDPFKWVFNDFYDKLSIEQKKQRISKILLWGTIGTIAISSGLITFGFHIFKGYSSPVEKSPPVKINTDKTTNLYKLTEEQFLKLSNSLEPGNSNYKQADIIT